MFKKILVADDHSIVRLGVSVAFESRYHDVDVALAENYYEAVRIMSNKNIDLLIMDIQMPGVEKHAIRDIKRIHPMLKVLLFSGFTGEMMRQLIHEGADGYLNKQASYEEIIEAVQTLYETGFTFPIESIRKNFNISEKLSLKKLLSAREYEIAMLMAEGKGNLEITNILLLKPGTVSTYKKRIFTKLEIDSLADLIKICLELTHIDDYSRRL